MINKLATVTQKFSPGLRKIIGNTTWLLADRILRMGAGLFVGIWVARYLGPTQFGLFNYAIAFFSLFDTTANLGLNSIVVRDIVRAPERKDEILGTAFTLKLLAQIAALLLAVGSVSLLRPDDNLTQWLVGILAIGMIFQSLDVIDFWFQSQVQSKHAVLAKNIGFVLANFGRIILIQLQAPLIMFAWAWSAEFIFGAIGVAIAYQFKGHLLKAWRYSSRCAVELLKDSWTLILSSFVIMIYMRIDQLMLGQMIGDQAVGIYSAAVKVSELWYFIPGAITSSVFPAVIKAKQVSNELYAKRVQQLLDVLSIMSYAVAITVSLLSTQFIQILYGERYLEAGAILAIHVWTGIFVSSGAVRSLWTTTEGLMVFAFASTATGAIVNIVLNYFLIKDYGGAGAAISTLIAQIFASYATNAFFSRTRVLFISQTKALMIPLFPKRLSRSVKAVLQK